MNNEDITMDTGTVTHSTLRWNGERWTQNTDLLASSDTLTVTTDFAISEGNTDVLVNDNVFEIETQSFTVTATNAATVSATNQLTLKGEL